jgi:hypothetical protein
MADDQSSVQYAEGSSHGTPISFDIAGDVPAIGNRPMINAHRKPPDLSNYENNTKLYARC